MLYNPILDGFDRGTISDWARAGIYPPPYCGALDPETVLFAQASQERWLDPPTLLVSDEQAVALQEQIFAARVGAGLMMTRPTQTNWIP